MNELSTLAAEVQKHDHDRFVTVLLAPAKRREALFALYAFNAEIARIREVVSEALLGEMRLQWWRDALGKIYAGGDLAHPVAQGISATIQTFGLSRAPFDRLLDARTADLSDGPPSDLAALLAYAEGTSSTLVALALETLGARGEAAVLAARQAGIGWALTGLLRAAPFHARTGRVYLPGDLLDAHGLRAGDIPEMLQPSQSSLPRKRESSGPMDSRFRGNDEKIKVIAEILERRAREHFAQARSVRDQIPRAARSALLIVPMGEVYLRRLRAVNYDLSDTRWSAVRPPTLRLMLRSWVAGY